MNKPALAAAILLVASQAQATAFTLAWHRVFSVTNGSSAAGTLATDVSGNGYMVYASSTSTTNVAHLIKISPAEGIYFDAQTSLTTAFTPFGAFLSPLISGKQYAYLTGEINDSQGNHQVWIKKYDNSGTPQWSGNPFVFASASGHGAHLVGFYADSSGNAFLAMDAFDSSSHEFLQMTELDASGNVIASTQNNHIGPLHAFYSPSRNHWVVDGTDLLSVFPFASARWGIYDPATGNEITYFFADSITPIGMGIDNYQLLVSPLPNGDIGAILNHEYTSNIINPATDYHTVFVFDSAGKLVWSFPKNSGYDDGVYLSLASDSVASPIYGAGDATSGYEVLDKFDWSGNRIWRRTHQPVQKLFASADGFYASDYENTSNTYFLEHYNSATDTYDWGRSYPNTALPLPPQQGDLAFFQNAFYARVNVTTSSSGATQVVLDRFVVGPALQNISSLAAVHSGNQLAVTLSLNDFAPTGGIQVGFNSSSSSLLMPNGTRGQFFTVPAGTNALQVTLNAQTVSTNTPVYLLAISNGIRRSEVVTVMP